MIAWKLICIAISLLGFSGSFGFIKETISNYSNLSVEEKLTKLLVFVAGILISLAPISWFIF